MIHHYFISLYLGHCWSLWHAASSQCSYSHEGALFGNSQAVLLWLWITSQNVSWVSFLGNMLPTGSWPCNINLIVLVLRSAHRLSFYLFYCIQYCFDIVTFCFLLSIVIKPLTINDYREVKEYSSTSPARLSLEPRPLSLLWLDRQTVAGSLATALVSRWQIGWPPRGWTKPQRLDLHLHLKILGIKEALELSWSGWRGGGRQGSTSSRAGCFPMARKEPVYPCSMSMPGEAAVLKRPGRFGVCSKLLAGSQRLSPRHSTLESQKMPRSPSQHCKLIQATAWLQQLMDQGAQTWHSSPAFMTTPAGVHRSAEAGRERPNGHCQELLRGGLCPGTPWPPTPWPSIHRSKASWLGVGRAASIV